LSVFCGIDWASDHHDVVIIDGTGSLLTSARQGDLSRIA
jgi:hypothetical protein